MKFFTLSICISSFFSTNPSRFHTISSLFRFFSIQILSCLQPISRNGLNQHCSIQTISHGSPPFVGGTLRGRKTFFFLVRTVIIRNRSIWGPCKFLIFVTKHHVKTFFVFPHPTILLPEYDLKGGTSLSFDETLYHRHILWGTFFSTP